MLKLLLNDFQKQDGVLTTKVFKCFQKIIDATEKLCDASKLLKSEKQLKLCCLQYVISHFCVLCIYGKMCQKPQGLNFKKPVIEMRSFQGFLKDKRNDLVEEALQFEKDTCEEMDTLSIKRSTVRKKKIMPEEMFADKPLTFDEEAKR